MFVKGTTASVVRPAADAPPPTPPSCAATTLGPAAETATTRATINPFRYLKKATKC
jgi:hypothetical protein